MYHIKKDKRSETSANMLYGALLTCLQEKTFDEISITEITQLSTVSRSTFYRNFDEMIDILYWKCDKEFQEVLTGYIADGIKENLGLLEYVFSYWESHSDILEILISIHRIDIIYDSFYKNSAIVNAMLREKFDIPEGQEEYFMSIRIGVFLGMISTWLKGGKKETAHQLSIMLGEQLSFTANNNLIF